MDDETLADGFSALSDPRRLRALRFIAARDPACGDSSDAVCACHVQDYLGLSQPATSYHLKVLRQAGLVTAEKRGRWVHYRLSSDALEVLGAFLSGLDGSRPDRPESAA